MVLRRRVFVQARACEVDWNDERKRGLMNGGDEGFEVGCLGSGERPGSRWLYIAVVVM